MILQALTEYCGRLEEDGKVGQDGWSTAKVSYAITINIEGQVMGIHSLERQETRGKKQVMVPVTKKIPLQKGRSSKISPNFMCDNAKYLLGAWDVYAEGEQAEEAKRKALDCFLAALEYHIRILKAVETAAAVSVCSFFERWDFDREKDKLGIPVENLLQASNLVFRSYETQRYLHEDVDIKAAWNRYYRESQSSEKGRCLVTGKLEPVARLHPLIKGVRGAQSSGAALVSFNAPAFESYGKSQGANAPVSEYAANAYGKALNYLLSEKKLHQVIGDTTFVYWAESGEEEYADFYAEFLGDAEEREEDKLIDRMKAVAAGKWCDYENIIIKPDTAFYILGLAPNAARLSVRLFYRNSFGSIIKNIHAHYERLQICKPVYEKRRYISPWSVLYETVNQNSTRKEIQPILVGGFFDAILKGTNYPESIFLQLMLRIRADKTINYRRAAMLKAFLMKNRPALKGVADTMELNENTKNTAYVMGRIFAVLEQIQEEANRNINATIKDRYFVSACAAPSQIFPILLKLSQSHFRVLKRDNMGLYVVLNKKLGELLDCLESPFPKQLSLDEQGIFIIGYYQQVQKKYEKKNGIKEDK